MKGISTIIAVIIIVSVSIVMAIAVAYWAMGIGNSFTKFEKIEFTSIYADPPTADNLGNFTINIQLKNTGTQSATISNIFLNTRPWDTAFVGVTQTNLINQTLSAGASTSNAKIYLPIDTPSSSPNWSHGNSVQVEIQTAAGRTYPDVVVLP